ncbi:MAG: aconitase X swivel domain-containing protein [Thermoplasmatota archaeon]
MILQGRSISKGTTEGEVVKVDKKVSFLGDVDPEEGKVFDEISIKDSIFVFPEGRGSTVGSYVLYQLKMNGFAPKGIINKKTETIVATGAIISHIPLVDRIQIDLLKSGDDVRVNGDNGTVEIKNIDCQNVVTAFLRRNGKILLLKRSEEVGSFRGRWSGVSGYLEREDPIEQAEIEIEEETETDVTLVKEGAPILARGEGKIWNIHPFLFDSKGEIKLDWENVEYRWIKPVRIKNMKTVPKLWEAYESVR